jgi:hypothetical protein
MARTKNEPEAAEVEIPKGKQTHVVIHPIRHDGKYYPRNSLITLAGKDATRLEELGAAKPIATPTAQPTEVEPAVEG